MSVLESFHRPNSPSPSPFQREPEFPPGNSFRRLITAQALAQIQRTTAAEVAQRLWPSDLIVRAASAPAMTSVVGWAAELAHKIIMDAAEALAPTSSAATVIRRGLLFNMDGVGQISVPGFTVGAGNASFVAEGTPIPVRQLASTAAALNPFKLAAIAALTRELMASSNAEAAIGDALVRAMGAALDAAFFDSNAATTARPAGIRNGIVAQTASSATDTFEAVFEDVATLINAIAPVAGPGPYIIVASPGRALGLELRAEQTDLLDVYGSTALGNDICAIAPAALVAALSPNPDIETGIAATLVMDDTAPGAAGTAAEKSMFQTDSLALKVRWPITWALRSVQGVAWLTPTWK
jgi:hypothetical protein